MVTRLVKYRSELNIEVTEVVSIPKVLQHPSFIVSSFKQQLSISLGFQPLPCIPSRFGSLSLWSLFSEYNARLPLLAICRGPVILLHTQLCCCCICLPLLRISTLCPKVILLLMQPLHRKLPKLHRSILATVCQ
jgi:hypothetical protein